MGPITSNKSTQTAVVAITRELDRVIRLSRQALGHLLDAVQLELRAIEARRDPRASEWEKSVREALRDGSLLREIETQPSPEMIVGEWRSTKTA